MQAPPTTPTRFIITEEHIEKLEVSPKPKPMTSRRCFEDDHWVTPVKLDFVGDQFQQSMTKLHLKEGDHNDSGFMDSPDSKCEPSQMRFPMTENRMKHLQKFVPVALKFNNAEENELSEDNTVTPPTTPPSKPMSAERMTQLLRAPRSSKRTMPRISPEAEPTATTTTTNNVVTPVVLNFDDYDFGIPMRLPFDEDAIKEDEEFFFDLSDSEEEDDTSEPENDAAETD